MDSKIPLLLMLGSQDPEVDAEPAARAVDGVPWLRTDTAHDGSRRIVVATDLAPSSERAWRTALKLAARTGAMLDLVHVTDAYLQVFQAQGRPIYESIDDLIEGLRTTMQPYVKEALALGIPCGLQILVGVPAFEIARYARAHGAALVVLGLSGDLRGRTGPTWGLDVLEQILSCSQWRLVVLRSGPQDGVRGAN